MRAITLTALTLLAVFAVRAETPPDYERAASFESMVLYSLVKNARPAPNWIGTEDRFWVRNESIAEVRFVIVDAATGNQTDAFDHGAMASALTDAGLEEVVAEGLPITGLEFSSDGIKLTTTGGVFACALDASSCEKDATPPPAAGEFPSPDGGQVAFVRDHNLWLRDTADGSESAVTSDGEEAFAYGGQGVDLTRVQRRRTNGPRPVMGILWSPDSRYVATWRVDVRGVAKRSYVKEHLPPDDTFTVVHMEHATVAADRVALKSEISIIDTNNGSQVKVDVDPARLHDFSGIHFATNQVWWNLAGGELFFVTADNGGQTYGIAAANLSSGAVRTVVEESEEHYYAFTARDYNAPSFHVTADGREAIWYSQRSGSGQLYLYDARTGKLKNPISGTSGVVFDIIRVDEGSREVYFAAGGREPGRNPYYPHLYRVSFDGGTAQLLTPEDAAHEFYRFALPIALFGGAQSQFSPSGDFFVDVYSTINDPPVMVIRDKDGARIARVLSADISALKAHGWSPPERFVVKAADGETDLWGAMFKPADFDSSMKYAVVEQTYPGPQIDSAPHTFLDNFAAITTRNAQATAEIGVIVVALDGRGTTRRDRAFRYAFAGTTDTFGAADHKAAIENLAQTHPYLDADRVGVTGASFGGYGSVRAALLFPEFFDVVVSHVGPHEYLHSVPSGISVERFFGVPDSERDIYVESSNIAIIDNLQADLMLVYGEIDENVPFRSAMAIFDALIKADKDFTSYVVPNANHGGAAGSPYIVKRQRRFFREHLGGPRPR